MATLFRLYRRLEQQSLYDRESLIKLALRGWFLSPRMPVAAIPILGKAAESMPKDVDRVFEQHIQQHLVEIEAALTASYPHRSHLLQEAFWAHRECKYSLSIQAFLSQADGIFDERFGKPLFRKGSKGAVSTFSSEVRGPFFQAVLHPFTQSTPLWEHTDCLDDTFNGLNRHQVLHGMRVDYHTELNSLRAISLLDNLLWVLNRPADGC